MMITQLLTCMLLAGDPLSISDAWQLSSSLEEEYLNSEYSITASELDVTSMGAPLDSIHTMSIVETSFGFTRTGIPYAVLLFRDELVRVTFNDESGFSEQRYQIGGIRPYRMFCEPFGETALVLGSPTTQQTLPSIFVDLNSGSCTQLTFSTEQQAYQNYQISGSTLLVKEQERWNSIDVSGSVLGTTDSLSWNTEIMLADQGLGILITEFHAGRGMTISRLTREMEPVWTLDTGLSNIGWTIPEQGNTGFYHWNYRDPSSTTVHVLSFFSIETGERLSQTEFEENLPTIHTSRSGEYGMTRTVISSQGSQRTSFQAHRLNRNNPTLMYADSVESASGFLNLKVLAVADSGNVLMQRTDGYTSTSFFLLNTSGEVIWISRPIRGDDFPDFAGLFTGYFPPPARLDPSGNRVIYNDHHSIRMVTISETP